MRVVLLAIIAKLASELDIELCSIKLGWGVYEQNSIMNNIGVDDRTSIPVLKYLP